MNEVHNYTNLRNSLKIRELQRAVHFRELHANYTGSTQFNDNNDDDDNF